MKPERARTVVSIALAATAATLAAQEAPDILWAAEHSGSVSAVAFSPDGLRVASGGGSQDVAVVVWDAGDGTMVATFAAPSRPGATSTGVTSLDFSPDGLLAVGGLILSSGYPVPGGATDVWRLTDETLVHSFAGAYLSFSANGERLASGGGGINRQLVVHEIPSEEVMAGINTDGITALALYADGETAASGDFDGDVAAWDVESGSLLRTLANGGEVRALAFSPDGQMLASAGGGVDPDSTIKLWRVSDGALLQTLFGHDIGVRSLDFSPDGETLISSGTDAGFVRSIRFWRTADGALLETLDPGNSAVLSVDFSPDGATFLYGTTGGFVAVANTPVVALDTDADGVPDSTDNCTVVANSGQFDSNDDGIGNLCDGDIDGIGSVEDCVVNFLDLNAMKAAFFSSPVLPGWNPDADLDSSGSVNFADLTIMKSQFFGPPGPSAAGCN